MNVGTCVRTLACEGACVRERLCELACVCLRVCVRARVRLHMCVCACTHSCVPAFVCGLSYARACMMQIVILSDKKFENS